MIEYLVFLGLLMVAIFIGYSMGYDARVEEEREDESL